MVPKSHKNRNLGHQVTDSGNEIWKMDGKARGMQWKGSRYLKPWRKNEIQILRGWRVKGGGSFFGYIAERVRRQYVFAVRLAVVGVFCLPVLSCSDSDMHMVGLSIPTHVWQF